MQQRILRRTSFGSSSSLRRSSISAKDLQAIQIALQKQQRVSTNVVAVLLILLPIFSFFYLYSIHLHRGAFFETFKSMFAGWHSFSKVLPPIFDTVAWKCTTVLISVQLLLHCVLPTDTVLIMSSNGDYHREVNGFSSFILLCLLYVLGTVLGLYTGDTIFLHFNSIILCMACLALIIIIVMLVLYHFGQCHNVTTLSELYFGVELHPILLDIDVKHFLRSRLTYGLWPLFIISALFYQKTVQGKISNQLLCLSFLQSCYIFKFHWNEDISLNSIDERRAHCGFFRIWTDLVFYPVLFTSPVAVVVQSTRSLSLLACALFSLIGIFSIYLTAVADRQKYEFRKSKGSLKIGGFDPFFISAKYKTDTGESAANLLLGSGYWAISRHPNYLSEIVTFFCFSLLQGYSPLLTHSPAFFITGYLLVRLLNDESRCLAKYGQYWIQYCSKVPFKLLPGVF